MRRVAQVVEDLKIGGLEKVIENITMHLDPEKFDVSVLCLSRGGEIADRLTLNGKNVEILGISNYHSLASIMKVAKWFKQHRIDIVHTHGHSAGVLGRVAAIFAKASCIFHHVHSTYFDLNKRNHFIERFLSKFTRRVICCSSAVKQFVIEKEGTREDKLAVIYNGVAEPGTIDALSTLALKNSLGIPENAPVIGCVASLVGHKGHRYLIEAFKKTGNAYLLLVGDGILRNELEKFASEIGISDRVTFAGYKTDVLPYIKIMDIIALPSSEREGLGIAIIEAMALAKPIIASNIGGIPEVVIEGETGLLVKPKDNDAISNAINRLLNSPDLAIEIGKKGRERYLQTFTLNKMMSRIEKLYADCK